MTVSSRLHRLAGTVVVACMLAGCGQGKTAGRSNAPGPETPKTSSDDAPPKHQTAIRFTDVTPRTGIEFTPRNGEQAKHFSILESLGTGVALFDFDGDRRLDVFLPGGGEFAPGPRVAGRAAALYRNLGDWRFQTVTPEAGLDGAKRYTHGAFVADYDGDGFADVLVTGYGGVDLYRNCGDGTFENVSAEAGLDDRRWASAAAWGDFNGDGHLDLFLSHYVDWSFQNHPVCTGYGGARDVCSPNDFAALDDALFVADGNGQFRDATRQAGLAKGGKGLGAIAGDLDADGKVDIYVANDTTPNFLYRNIGNGRFREHGVFSGAALNDKASADGSMGLELADLNLDGRPDLWVTNFEHQSFALYRNDGGLSFQHVSSRMGITAIGNVYVGFGTVACDFDHDGDDDLVVANGHVMLHSRNSPTDQQPLLLENLEGKRFVDVKNSAGAYFQESHRGRGIARGDLDGDGRDDLVATHVNAPVRVLRNDSTVKQPVLRVRFVGVASSRVPVGATATLLDSPGIQSRFLTSGASYLSTGDTTLAFRLPDPDRPAKLRVRWPNGTTHTYAFPSAGEYLVTQNGQPLRLP